MEKFQMIKADKHVKMISYPGGSQAERAEYFTLTDIDKTKLQQDIRKGAVFLEGVDSLLKEKRMPKVVYIHAGTEELGLIALNWIEKSLKKDDDCFEYDPEDFDGLFDDEEDEASDDVMEIEYGTPWGFIAEDPSQVPLIPWDEIVSYFRDDDSDSVGIFGGNAFRFAKSGETQEPYWTHCNTNPVCIVQSGYEDFLIKPSVMEQFKDNSRVYILRIDPLLRNMFNTVELDSCDDDDFPFGCETTVAGENMRKTVIMCNADYVKISMDEDQTKRYYTEVLKQIVSNYKFRLDTKINKDELVDCLMNLCNDPLGNPECSCGDFIEKALCHVIERKKKGKVIKEGDLRYILSERDDKKKGNVRGWERLDKELIGMPVIKKRIRSIVNNFKFEKIRAEKGLSSLGYHNVYMMLGAPGTAKTTVAQILGDIMTEEKLLSGKRFISINGAELKGKYVGWTTDKVKQLFSQYDIIFVDEAYSLVSTSGDSDEFSQEAVAQLCIELEKHAQDRLVIFAGYGGDDVGEKSNLMKHFLDSNPGITSRINSTIFFPSYTPDEMVEIFHKQADIKKISMDRQADEEVRKYFEWRRKAKDFGNGREARSLFEASIMKMAERISAHKGKHSVKALNTMTAEDILGALEEKRMVASKLTGKTKPLGFVV